MGNLISKREREKLAEVSREPGTPSQEFSRHLRIFRGRLFTPEYKAPKFEGIAPRLVCVGYDQQSAIRAANLVRELPPGSVVALPLDSSSKQVRQWRGFSDGPDLETEFFTELAKHAVRCGHRVIRLERPAAFLTPAERKLERDRHDTFKRAKQGFDKLSVNDISKLVAAQEGMMPWHGKLTRLMCRLVVWRSTMIAREIVRKSDWKETDLVLLGRDQADDVASLLGWKIAERFIGTRVAELESDVAHHRIEYRELMRGRSQRRWWRQMLARLKGRAAELPLEDYTL